MTSIEWCYGPRRSCLIKVGGPGAAIPAPAGTSTGRSPAVTESSRMPEYSDEQVLLSVEPPTASRSTIRLHAAGSGVGALVDLSATGASRLASMLNAAAITASARDLGQEAP